MLNRKYRPKSSFKPRKRLERRHHPIASRRGLIEALDEVVSLIVRKRDGECVTCGEARPHLLTCSHFYSRRFLNTRFDLRNCNTQCINCNCIVHVQNPWPYTQFFLSKYDTSVMAELFELRNRRETPTNDELRFMLNEYRATLREMNG